MTGRQAEQPEGAGRLAEWLTRHRAAWSQMVRVMIACAVTYGIFKLFGLEQGYWAVFTVLIVMQGSVGATLGAAMDRLIATVAGALVGGVAVLVTPHRPLEIGVALVVVAGASTLVATLNPRLRNAGLTAAIVILTRAPDVPVLTFVIHRILEIAMGGIIGVIASRLILPARSTTALVEKLGSVLTSIAETLRMQAEALEGAKAFSWAETGISLRTALTATEALLADAGRERSARLEKRIVSDAIPRNLWRIRNDITHINRLIETPFNPAMLAVVGGPAAMLLRAEGAFADRCGSALKQGARVVRDEDDEALHAFEAAFAALRQSEVAQDMAFDDAGRLFGLAFALQRMRQDLLDLADRIDESR